MGSQTPISKGDILPRSLPPAGISRTEAAAFIGVSPTKFDDLVSRKIMPGPKKIDGRTVWSVRKLTLAFEALPDDAERNGWDETCGLSSGTGRAS